MNQNVHAVRVALIDINTMVGEALASPSPMRPPKPTIMQKTRPEVSCDIKGLKQPDLCDYLRENAPRDVLFTIRHDVQVALSMLDEGDDVIDEALAMAEPFRHQLYTSVVVAALRAAERSEIRQEVEYWRQQKIKQARTLNVVGA